MDRNIVEEGIAALLRAKQDKQKRRAQVYVQDQAVAEREAERLAREQRQREELALIQQRKKLQDQSSARLSRLHAAAQHVVRNDAAGRLSKGTLGDAQDLDAQSVLVAAGLTDYPEDDDDVLRRHGITI
jgi:hypothetical protein